jgi:secreted PhoX family phosphatase
MNRRQRPPISRRSLLRGAGGIAAAVATGLGSAISAAAGGSPRAVRGYGPLVRDARGLLDLPQGFGYQIISRVGEPMSDGLRVPGLPDGMHAFSGAAGRVRLLRNHELNPRSSETAFVHLPGGPPAEVRQRMYDPAVGRGGVSTVIFDPKSRRVEREFLSLAGTLRNCAGGVTPWGSWISCEEMVIRRGDGGALEDHGYNFEVPAAADSLVDAVALTAMGRFNHEAVGIDPATGIVYQTEDRADGLIYRFLPDAPGKLAAGGRLQGLALADHPAAFTGNWQLGGRVPVGVQLATAWVDLKDVSAPNDDLRYQGRSLGAAAFARGEGVAVESNADAICVWFICTAGGTNKRGQLWCYRPSRYEGTDAERAAPGTLELFVEPNDSRLLNRGDNICVAPFGDLVVCEDSKDAQRLVGVTAEGGMYVVAGNARGDSEFAGATFAPHGGTLFVNLQNPGLTFAVTGPWASRDTHAS